MESPSKAPRKVRFTLPVPDSEHNIRTIDFDFSKIGQRPLSPATTTLLPLTSTEETKVHGTTRYINGVLKFCPSEHQPVVTGVTPPPPPLPPKTEPKRENKFKPITILKPCIKRFPKQPTQTTSAPLSPSRSKRIPKLNLSKKLHSFIGAKRLPSCDASSTTTTPTSQRHSVHINDDHDDGSGDRKKVKLKAKSTFRSHAVIFSPYKYLKPKPVAIARQSPRPAPRRRRKATARPITKLPNLLSVPLTYETSDALGHLVDHLCLSDVPTTLTASAAAEPCQNHIPQTPFTSYDADVDDVDAYRHLPADLQDHPRMTSLLVSSDTNLTNFVQFVDRWRYVRQEASQKLNNRISTATTASTSAGGGTTTPVMMMTTTTTTATTTGGESRSQQAVAEAVANRSTVHTRIFKQSDDKSSTQQRQQQPAAPATTKYRTRKMNLQKVPLVTTLLRASRDADEELLRSVLRDILINGIPSHDLNAEDNSGRTALSYICSTNLTHILDIFLKIQGIEINKADKEGNTPLHFAAQSGQSEAINMLLTRSRSIEIDAKNNLGFTPLMKAALQGRTRCAKLLLFAGASPVEIDYGRGFRAEQWSRFCGRYSCAEMIEKCARVRLLEKATSCKWSHDSLPFDKTKVTRTRTNPAQSPPQSPTDGGIRSKLRKVFPFNFSLKDKLSSKSHTDKSDLANYIGGAQPLPGQGKPIKSLIRPLEVPKVQVTPANNHVLIKKYEALYGKGENDDVIDAAVDVSDSDASPKLPPRSKIRSN